jgi:spore coat polysaccharide biosynthesis protein SpsF (cytidylyltransferase family)
VILAVVQARMGSSRLPGKVLKEVMGKPLLGYLLERLSASRRIDRALVATTTNPADDRLCDWLARERIDFFRGDENDVLDRYYRAARPHAPSVVVRLTGDCPLIDPEIVDRVVDLRESGGYDHVSNGAVRPVYPDGLDAEAFTFRALEAAWRDARLASEREHVTTYIKNSGLFRTGNLHPERDYYGERWTVDSEEDFKVVKAVLEALYRPGALFHMGDVLALKARRPELFEPNRHIERNAGYAKSLAHDRDLGRRGGRA